MALTAVRLKNNKVTLESDLGSDPTDRDRFIPAIEELQHADARRVAIAYAADNGVQTPACGTPSGIYAVNEEGEEVTPLSNTGPIYRYRVDIPVTSRMGGGIV